jgi:flagellin-like protein
MKLLTMKNRKGISPLIATLLLIAIAVAASVLTYSWVMSMIGSQSGQAQTQSG